MKALLDSSEQDIFIKIEDVLWDPLEKILWVSP